MNVHFLELFYYVAKYEGISAAVRNIPYGIQQPAISTQIGKLEQDLGVRLSERTPFRLTRSGELLYSYVGPFFDQMPSVAQNLRTIEQTELRIGGAELILRDHLPLVLRQVKKRYPRIRYSLRTVGDQAEVEAWLRKGEIDLAFVPLSRRPPTKLRQLAMVKFPLILQVHSKSKLHSAAELFGQKHLSTPLICLPQTSSISRNFQSELRRRGIRWPQTIEASSLDLVSRYVANGDGVGVNVEVESGRKLREIRALRLENFPPVTMGAVWSGELSASAAAALDGVHAYAKQTWPTSAC